MSVATIVIFLLMSVVGFADNGGGNDFPKNPNYINDNRDTNINTNLSNNENRNTNLNANMNRNVNVQGQAQGQLQGQLQGQKQKQGQGQGQSQSVNGGNIAPVQSVTLNEAKQRINAPEIRPFDIPILQNGKIGDFTGAIPDFMGMKKLAKEDKIVKVLKVVNGSFISRIRIEDLYQEILDNAQTLDVVNVNTSKIRYQVWWKDSVTNGGAGGGVGGSSGSIDQATSGSFLPGYHSSTSNPSFLIYYVEIQ